jgi:hypothetical protein
LAHYDQTKLVVIEEEFRELSLNERFARYATTVGFRIRACEGYDPESKGKVEAGVKYVKNDGLYGESFGSWSELTAHLLQWLEETANARVHATTDQVPRAHYAQEEKPAMATYLSPPGIAELQGDQPQTRKADKTGLIAFKANKYSVPLAYQRSRVGVIEEHGRLVICDLHTGEVVARHALSCGKGDWRRSCTSASESLWEGACAPCSRPASRASTKTSSKAPSRSLAPTRSWSWP